MAEYAAHRFKALVKKLGHISALRPQEPCCCNQCRLVALHSLTLPGNAITLVPAIDAGRLVLLDTWPCRRSAHLNSHGAYPCMKLGECDGGGGRRAR